MREQDLKKLEKASQMISEVIFEYKEDWEKQYKWVSFLLHGQGAIKNAISEFKKKEWEVKEPLVGEREKKSKKEENGRN